MTRLRDATIEALDQIRSLIVAVEDASGHSENLYAGSGIGLHVRHVADHFRAFQVGIKFGTVNYNVRRRDSALELQSDLSLMEIDSIIAWLQTFTVAEIPVTVESEISCSRTETVKFKSNAIRELLYLINHTIHHAAYAALLVRQHGVSADPAVGYAPATVSYMRNINAKSEESRSQHTVVPLRPIRSLAD